MKSICVLYRYVDRNWTHESHEKIATMIMNVNVWISSCYENKLFDSCTCQSYWKENLGYVYHWPFRPFFNNTLLWLLNNMKKILMIYFRIIVMVERWMKESWRTKEYVPFQKINTMWPLKYFLTVVWCDVTFKHYQWNKLFIVLLTVIPCRNRNIFQRNKSCRYS